MMRSRPAPLLDTSAFHSAPPTFEAADGSEMPVRNTFIDFSEQQVDPAQGWQPVTAPGKFVGRLAGPFTQVSTSTGTAACTAASSSSSMPVGPLRAAIPAAPPPTAPPPPLQTPRVPAEVAGPGPVMPPLMSPHLPPEYAALPGRGIPPPPQASPTVAGSTASEAHSLQPSPQRPQVQPVQQGSIIEVRPMGQVTSPPRFGPPSYTVNFMATPCGSGLPPPMHSPVCATPAGTSGAPAVAAASCGPPVGPAISRCFPASAAPQATPAGVHAGMVWPATPSPF